MISIATWNINSINAHLPQLLNFTQNHQPDILLLQETKCEDAKFPHHELPQYQISHLGQKSYNGVAILSKFPIQNIKTTFPNNPAQDQARFIQTDVVINDQLLSIINVYVPNGSSVGSDKFELKISFLDELLQYLNKLPQHIPTIIGGDFNVAPFDIDVYSPNKMQGQLLFSDQEKYAMRKILNSYWLDAYRIFNPNTAQFSWWDYRHNSFNNNTGCRIDFLLSNAKLLEKTHDSKIITELRGFKDSFSDHTVIINFLHNFKN